VKTSAANPKDACPNCGGCELVDAPPPANDRGHVCEECGGAGTRLVHCDGCHRTRPIAGYCRGCSIELCAECESDLVQDHCEECRRAYAAAQSLTLAPIEGAVRLPRLCHCGFPLSFDEAPANPCGHPGAPDFNLGRHGAGPRVAAEPKRDPASTGGEPC
jgi:hypothetical protein